MEKEPTQTALPRDHEQGCGPSPRTRLVIRRPENARLAAVHLDNLNARVSAVRQELMVGPVHAGVFDAVHWSSSPIEKQQAVLAQKAWTALEGIVWLPVRGVLNGERLMV